MGTTVDKWIKSGAGALETRQNAVELACYLELLTKQAEVRSPDVLTDDVNRLQTKIAPLITIVQDMERATQSLNLLGTAGVHSVIKKGVERYIGFHDDEKELKAKFNSLVTEQQIFCPDRSNISNCILVSVDICDWGAVTIICIYGWSVPRREDVITVLKAADNGKAPSRYDFPRQVWYFVRSPLGKLLTTDVGDVEKTLEENYFVGLSKP